MDITPFEDKWLFGKSTISQVTTLYIPTHVYIYEKRKDTSWINTKIKRDRKKSD